MKIASWRLISIHTDTQNYSFKSQISPIIKTNKQTLITPANKFYTTMNAWNIYVQIYVSLSLSNGFGSQTRTPSCFASGLLYFSLFIWFIICEMWIFMYFLWLMCIMMFMDVRWVFMKLWSELHYCYLWIASVWIWLQCSKFQTSGLHKGTYRFNVFIYLFIVKTSSCDWLYTCDFENLWWNLYSVVLKFRV